MGDIGSSDPFGVIFNDTEPFNAFAVGVAPHKGVRFPATLFSVGGVFLHEEPVYGEALFVPVAVHAFATVLAVSAGESPNGNILVGDGLIDGAEAEAEAFGNGLVFEEGLTAPLAILLVISHFFMIFVIFVILFIFSLIDIHRKNDFI
jgi:hypothetical protein